MIFHIWQARQSYGYDLDFSTLLPGHYYVDSHYKLCRLHKVAVSVSHILILAKWEEVWEKNPCLM